MANPDQPEPRPGGSPGPGVDRYGTPVLDPSPNVLDLVKAAIDRQDDLRTSWAHHNREMSKIRADYDMQLRAADRHDAELRAGYEEKLRDKETARIDAIRAVDVGAVSRAAEVSAAQATTLATQQQASADALRNQVEQARIATADALAQALAPLQKSIEDLRAAQYQQQGEKSSKAEGSTENRDALALEQTRIQAAQARMQMYALVIAAIVLAVGLYGAFHK
jgi:small-conductance mechanosensitive channel